MESIKNRSSKIGEMVERNVVGLLELCLFLIIRKQTTAKGLKAVRFAEFLVPLCGHSEVNFS